MEMKWFLADLVVEVRAEGADRSLVQFELHLIRARSAAEAYDKALRIGGGKATQIMRYDGAIVTHTFRGLNDLVLVEEEFEDGSRILFRSQPEMTDDEVRGVLTPREYLRAIQAEAASVEPETIQ